MKVAFCTLGCKVNYYETQAMEQLFRSSGYEIVPFETFADIYVINTCTVTQTSDQKSRQMISRAYKQNPNALIVAAGCYAETARSSVSQLNGVSLVLGTEGRQNIVTYCEAMMSGRYAGQEPLPLFSRREFEELSATRENRTRAVLKIQDGCKNFCTYCAIPFARGLPRSRSLVSCKNELSLLASEGFSEIVLTGIELSEYGIDLPGQPTLSDVVRIAGSVSGIKRIRLGSLDPSFIDSEFIDALKQCPSFCPQFHLSLQSGSDTVLSRMRRKYNCDDYRHAVSIIREAFPDSAITTDVIAGFVGETEEEHSQTISFVKEIAFSRMHVFPYSVRKGTAAASMPGHLPKVVREKRAKELISIGHKMEQSYVQSQIGKKLEVLMEEDGTGYSRNYVRVRCNGHPGQIINVHISGCDGTLAIGEAIQ